MDVRLLGDVEIEAAGVTYTLGRTAERCVLATLAFNPGRVVPLGTFVAHIWGEHPPPKAEETVATYVRAVRRMIEQAGGGREWLVNRRSDGYRLDIDPVLVDHRRFTDLAGTARVLARQRDDARAVETFERALRLWRGEALANVAGQWAKTCRHGLRLDRLRVTYELLELLLRASAYGDVATRAADLVREEPTERAIALALRGLAGSGQRALIPSFLARAAEQMREVNGSRPSADLVALARRLAGEPEAAVAAPPEPAAGTVVMNVRNATNVYQASGDQYFSVIPPRGAPGAGRR
ncbi:BTAD domain-containing putative transcriptional regulator [Phytohabitans sp. ZYX-F-186]|uniref:BTAD domain-containing putative transcriptional regulator n=1 Tax=Phytohabitans maris TaxID=3071409 RepID=A0ABU0Z856_9ACTN|nr:BTAD domain-containing putative transcriptional regulator [Phytohabitans sp. ZYX-F-186]MDQ7903188.1 BTAD domain-containing putative transcriptional regulator [Phytohabitans sp. ZYX-F-186]